PTLEFLIFVGVHQKGERDSIDTTRRLDHVRCEMSVRRLIKVGLLENRMLVEYERTILENSPSAFRVARQVIIGTVCDSFHFVKLLVFIITFWEEAIEQVRGCFRVMSQFFRRLYKLFEVLRSNPILVIPVDSLGDPLLMPLLIGAWHHEEFNLHLLELAHAENEILGCDLVSVCLTNLSNSERQLAISRIENVFEIDEDALRCFGPQISNVVLTLDRPDGCLEHQIEWPGLRQIMRATLRTLFVELDL